jgi:HEPN domain-containing protein
MAEELSQIEYWLKSAEHDLDAAEGLLNIKQFDWCLFLGHLVLEKTFKAAYVKKCDDTPPRTHNLLFLAEKAGITLAEEQKIFLEQVNDFNTESRYPDEKLSFYRLCTESFTREKFDKIKEFYVWLRREMRL